MKFTLLGTLFLTLVSCGAAQVTVNVTSPLAYATVTAPIHVHATAASAHPITGWHVYMDGNNAYSGPATNAIDAYIVAATGTHQFVIRAWDTTGAYGDQTFAATASGSAAPPPPPPTAGLPTPPASAKVYSNINQKTTGWGSCNTGACAGGNGGGAYWQAFNQSSPSMSGRSMEIYHDGVWSNALWYYKVGANSGASNFLWDFYVNLDAASVTQGQSLEYDAFQFVGGYNYMIGTQCDYGSGTWDTWNEVTQKWLHTTIPCKKFAAGTWHHIQWYMTTNHTNHTYTYKTLVVDGVIYNLNQTQPAKYLGWPDNSGCQWQLDVNAKGGGYHEWVDNAKLSIW